MNWEEKDRLSDEIIGLLDGTDASALQLVIEKLGIGVVTKHHVVKRDEMKCDPIIWVEDDLEEVTLEQWCEIWHPCQIVDYVHIDEYNCAKRILCLP
jgi:hypothetical protein